MTRSNRIAIVSMGGIYPGAVDMAGFYANVMAGRSAAREPQPGRWLLPVDEVYSSVPAEDRVLSRRACFVEDFVFDSTGLEIDTDLVKKLDPMYLFALHAGRDAWVNATTNEIDKSRVGVILGNIALPTDSSSALADELLGPMFEAKILDTPPARARLSTAGINRYVAGLPGGLLAGALGLGGGAHTLDAACASSLYAIKYAVDELQSGRADAMIAGGLSRPDSLYTQMGFSQLRAVSPTGVCSPFDEKADGLVVGEGAGIFVLKRLEDAIAQGDVILATIAGIGLSNDIDGNLMQPASEGQLRAMRSAYEQAGWQPSDVQLIECHGTGTPVGDAVEFDSLSDLWRDAASDKRCVIGSVKSNVGHLLTGAGAAGLAKVLLAMRHGKLPPTANFKEANRKLKINGSPFEVLSEAREWVAEGNEPRRAAVSAFGFGGINAHLLLEEYHPETSMVKMQPVEIDDVSRGAVAIVGMAAHFGPWKNLDEFEKRVMGGGDKVEPGVPEHWWSHGDADQFRGYFIDKVEVPVGRFRIPPSELKDMLPQQLLMLQVAADALEDAGVDIDPKDSKARRTDFGVYIGIGLDLNTTNFHFRWGMQNRAERWAKQLNLDLTDDKLEEWIGQLRKAAGPALTANRTMGALGGIVASRIARAFRIGGPSFTVSSEQTSSLHALETAVRSLQRGEIDSAIVGGVDLAGDLRAVMADDDKMEFTRGLSRVLDEDADGCLIGEGAAAVIVKRYDDAVADGDRIYATIDGIGAASNTDEINYQLSVERALNDAGISVEGIGLIEADASGQREEDARELTCLSKVTAERKWNLPCAVGSVKAEIGHTGAAAGLASIVKSAVCLHRQSIAPVSHVSNPLELPDGLYIANESQYWLRDRIDGPRRALVAGRSIDGNVMHIVMGGVEPVVVDNPRISSSIRMSSGLFVISGGDVASLRSELDQLWALASRGDHGDIDRLAARWWREHQEVDPMHAKVVLVSDDMQQLSFMIDQAKAAVRDGRKMAEGGIYYTPEPLGIEGEVAFVYPGSGNDFLGMGRAFSAAWPGVLNRLDAENDRLASQYADLKFWTAGSTQEFSHKDYIFGQVWLGTFVSDLVSGFNINPDAIIGYSLGETAGMFSTRSWTARDEMLDRITKSTLFTEDIAGPCKSVREAWGLADNETVDWVLGMVNCPAQEIVEHLPERVYLLIVNTPSECVIGGDRKGVEQLVNELGCVFHSIQGVTTVHCEVAKPVFKPYRDLHLFDTNPPRDIQFYSGIWGSSYEVTRESIADSIVGQAVEPFDYTKVINSAYADGVRIFVEMGPGGSCSRMIRQILDRKPHVAVAVCPQTNRPMTALLHGLGQLTAEGVAVDLSPLYDRAMVIPRELDTGKPVIKVDVGNKGFEVPELPVTQIPSVNDEVAAEDVDSAHNLPPAQPQPTVQTEYTLTSSELDQGRLGELIANMAATEITNAQTQETFLRISQNTTTALANAIGFQQQLLQLAQSRGVALSSDMTLERQPTQSIAFDRDLCMEFAIGSIAKVLGEKFAAVDAYPTRVRLPDEPLMLVDRIVEVDGEPCSMTHGRVVTEHDIHTGAWYLDCGRIPTCIAVEAGQADLFLSGYLGIDLQTKGMAVYRLLDAVVTFHRGLPGPCEVIRYNIRIDHFFRQGDTYLFRFNFEATVNGQPLLSMTDGCAGFFTEQELAAGQGIVLTAMDRKAMPGKRPADWISLAPIHDEGEVESYGDEQIDALRRGDLPGCFGAAFTSLPVENPVGLPGGRMTLVHRILSLDMHGGRFGMGVVTGEADIHPDDWFLTCHFVDDRVMPGTLMYECCLHTLRVLLLRMGWIGEAGEVAYEPVPGVGGQLKCRGQVLETTKKVQYEVTVKEYGYGDHDEPYVIADALMSADGKAIVQMKNMSLRLSGLTRSKVENLWNNDKSTSIVIPPLPSPPPTPGMGGGGLPSVYERKPAIFDNASIVAFAEGKPSEAFGDRYRVFDEQRVIARLPRAPYKFLDRITSIENCEPWVLKAGAVIEAQYDVPPDAWYFASNRQAGEPEMPFAVLLEVALQPCGWLAAYLGSALTSEVDLSFRNLGGEAVQLLPVTSKTGTLTTTVKMASVSQSGGMIIQHYEMVVSSLAGEVYRGKTYFGFFTKAALKDQVGIRDAVLYQPPPEVVSRGIKFVGAYPTDAPYADKHLQMVDRIELFDPEGGSKGLGFIRGTKAVDPDDWFFKAHFYQDPVCPGSLGLESFQQLLQYMAIQRWGGEGKNVRFESMARGEKHQWVYRGQIIPSDRLVTIEAEVTDTDEERKILRANGFLIVDDRIIYQMTDFTFKVMDC